MKDTKNLSTSIDCPWQKVYEFARNPENLPLWASGIGTNLRREGSRFIVDLAGGPVEIRFVDRNELGVLDHFVTTSDGQVFFNPMRVVENDGGAEVIFTVFRFPGVSEEQFVADAATVARDLQALKAVLEGGKV